MKIAIVTDAWHPQVNGVVRTLTNLTRELKRMGHELHLITPDQFPTVPCPRYPEIRLAWWNLHLVGRRLHQFRPDAIHISTEGPLGFAARRFCLAQNLPFTTAYHTRLPEYVQAKALIPSALTYALIRRFHAFSRAVMVPTPSMQEELEKRGFGRIRQWTRGVDTSLFRPRQREELTLVSPEILALPQPVFLCVGRVSGEKNLAAFLSLPLPGSKLIVGDGPDMRLFMRRFGDTHFVGAKHGEALAQHYSLASVFVFPSLSDTFGNVVLEALASGVPVAAFPVTGPKDIIGDTRVGCLSSDLLHASMEALHIDRRLCRQFAERKTWSHCAEQFFANLAPIARTRQLQPAA